MAGFSYPLVREGTLCQELKRGSSTEAPRFLSCLQSVGGSTRSVLPPDDDHALGSSSAFYTSEATERASLKAHPPTSDPMGLVRSAPGQHQCITLLGTYAARTTSVPVSKSRCRTEVDLGGRSSQDRKIPTCGATRRYSAIRAFEGASGTRPALRHVT